MKEFIAFVFFISMILTGFSALWWIIRVITKQYNYSPKKIFKRSGVVCVLSLFVLIIIFSNEENIIEDEVVNDTIIQNEETEEDDKKSCIEYSYKDVLRNPSEYIGNRIKVTLKVTSVHEESFLNDTKYYLGITQDEYGYWYGDRYGIFDKRKDGSMKILSEDVITVYGEIVRPEHTSSLIVNSEEIFCIEMKYSDLIEE